MSAQLRSRLTCAAAFAAVLFLGLPAWAQTSFPTDNPRVSAQGNVPMCLDQNGAARACPLAPLPVKIVAGNTKTPYPTGAFPITGIGTGTTGAVVGTLAAAPGRNTWVCGFDVSAIGGTAPVGPIVIAGLSGGSFTYQLSSAAAGATLSRTFTPCIPSSAVNTAITITTTADGTATAVDVNSWGFQF